MKNYARIILKPKREASVLRRHPWIFSGGIVRVEGKPETGALVVVHSAGGEFLAWGHYSPHSQIRARLVSWDADETPDTPTFWRGRIQRAIAGRVPILSPTINACRLVHAESDGIPGLIVDRYAGTVVVQYLTAGTEARRELFTDLLWELLSPRSLYERSDADVRQKEGLASRVGLLRGVEPPGSVEIIENGLYFGIDVRQGHKSGFYLDQRENRQRLRDLVAGMACTGPSPDLLNAFAYTGGFAVYGLAGGVVSVVNVDTSADVLRQGRENLARNGFETASVEDIVGDAFAVLRDLRQAGRQFDVIVLDPPKFAFTQRDVQKAARGYKDINMQALHLLRPGGLLLTFSCSGAISADLFQKILFGAALDAGVEARIIGTLTQGRDHPVALTFPEGAYLKGLVVERAYHG
ncbi:MAG: class I SAM-dependent rRNA methyltransferase [Anaerolineae bacterium]|nr:class I SAM-dependent rRNA methyltransferase [Anaerolineae bacterium]